MNTRSVLLALVLALGVAGCGTINNQTITDEKLRSRAAAALEVSPDQITISNRSNEGIRINFTATVGKRAHQCYVTSTVSMMGVLTSDALCSSQRGSGSGKKVRCNKLLKAAGHC